MNVRLICTHRSNNPENLVKIGPVFSEIIGLPLYILNIRIYDKIMNEDGRLLARDESLFGALQQVKISQV